MYTENDCQRFETIRHPLYRSRKSSKEADRAIEREKATIAAENEAKTAENERLKIEAEKAKVKAEKEIEMAKIAAQRESETEARRNEIEAKRLKIENQLQVRRLESEVQIRTSSSEDNIEHSGINDGMKTLKLPTFNEDKDDFDAYLNRFERACQAYAVKPENWSIQLARLLQGRVLEVYQRLADSNVTSYKKLKEGRLKRFKLSEGGYRLRFQKSRLKNGETPEQFVERIRKYLRKWREMANFEKNL